MKQFVVALKYDKGVIRINTNASSLVQAIEQVLANELAPSSAVIEVYEKTSCIKLRAPYQG